MKNRLFWALSMALVIGWPVLLVAQQFNMRPLPTQQLLPASSVHCLMQDAEGYLWYGTEGGLCRDNGYQIDVLRPVVQERSQESYRVNCIVEGARGYLFFGTADGLFCLEKKDYHMRRVQLDTVSHFIEALYVDRQQHLWVGTHGKVYECDDRGDVVRSYPCGLHDEPASVASFSEDSKGTIFVLLWRSGMLQKQKGESSFSAMEWPLTASPIQLMEDMRRQGYWVVTSGAGIQRMTIHGRRCELTAQAATMGDNKRNRVLFMLHDPQHGLFWTTTHDDLYAYRLDADGQLQEYPLDGWLPKGKKILDQMCVDKQGNIYVAGYTPHTFIISSPTAEVLRNPIDAICQSTGYPLLADRAVYDGDDLIWIWQGRQGQMLYHCKDNRVQPVPFPCDRTIRRSTLGGIWASSHAMVYRIWHDHGDILREEIAPLPKGGPVRCLHEQDGEALYVATDSVLYRITLAGLQVFEMATLPKPPHDMAVGHDGSIYLALGNAGIYRVSPGGEVQRMDQLHETFLSVCTMADGSVWGSTCEGNVYHYSPTGRTLTREPLLCSAHQAAIRCIRVDGIGHVWTLTDQEVCEYAPLTRAFRTFRNTDPAIDVSYFYAIEPIGPTRSCVGGAGARIELRSSAELSTQESAQVQPRLASVLVNGEKRLVGSGMSTVTLQAGEEDMTLQMTTLDHLHASSISFAYQLKGIQDEWVYLPQGTNSIILNNLPQGHHQLMVRATDRHGLWSQPVQVVTIYRMAHWWQTWWAFLLYIGMALVVGYAIWRLERRIHLLRHLIRRREEVRLNEIELKRDDIAVQQLNDEFLKRAIASIEANLSRTDYNVEALADDMCMSRFTFYRHLQEQTGQTPSEFIRDIRLKKAASLLLQHPQATVSDVARKVGFATPKYFSRCFKEKFGVLPKDYGAGPAAP